MGEAILKYLLVIVAVLVAFNEVIIVTQGRHIKASNQSSEMDKDTSNIDSQIPTSSEKAVGDSNEDHVSAHRPTTPGNSPGVGHKKFGVENEEGIKAKVVAVVESPDDATHYYLTPEDSKTYFKPTGHSPGVGHAIHQNKSKGEVESRVRNPVGN